MAKTMKMPVTESAPAKKLYLIRADDVDALETDGTGGDAISVILLKPGGRVIQIDDSPEGRGVLAKQIRRVVGEKAVTRLMSGSVKPIKN